jgi:hypothetical protein
VPPCLAGLALLAAPLPALANNLGENGAWQFKTAADRANQAVVLDLIEKRRGGYYAAPIYNTTIAHQYNCSISAVATANSSGQSSVANSPTVSGADASATGNANTASGTSDRGGTDLGSQQTNTGTVASGVVGSTDSVSGGTAWQALNSSQSNSGNQTASVQGSSACAFGALN